MIQEFNRYFESLVDFFRHQLPSITVGLGIFILLLILGKLIRRFTKQRLMRRLEDILLVNFIGRMIFLFFFVLGAVIFLNQVGLGKAASGLLAGAGVSAIIVGFAFKDIGENFLAGFFLAFSRPFSIGDTLEVENIKGIVRALNFRNTHIRTFDGKDIYVPNAMLIKNPLINYSRDGLQRFDFLVGLDYGDSFLEASKVIHETLEKQEGIEHQGALKPFLMLEEFGTSTVNVRIFYWINSHKYKGDIAALRSDVMNNVLLKLTDKSFSLPADIVELKIYQEGQPIPLKWSKTQANAAGNV